MWMMFYLGYIKLYGTGDARGRLHAIGDIEKEENAIKGLSLPRLGKPLLFSKNP